MLLSELGEAQKLNLTEEETQTANLAQFDSNQRWLSDLRELMHLELKTFKEAQDLSELTSEELKKIKIEFDQEKRTHQTQNDNLINLRTTLESNFEKNTQNRH